MSKLRRKNGRKDAWQLKYWGVGNENWGCGGNMRPQYYADEFRRFGSYCRNFSDTKLYKIACGHQDEWNEILMREAHQYMDGLSVHYYTIPGTWQKKGSATDFSEDEWHTTLFKAANIDDFLKRTETIMDRHDPARRIGMIVDEWGTWFDVAPGTNPGFLYQQNTLRDALVAGVSLNIFNAHAERVHMANIAQTINVLQSMILTEGPKMLCTPTFHVFEMYKVHQDATLLPSHLECGKYEIGKEKMDQLSVSTSRSAKGTINLSVCNLHHDQDAELNCEIRGTAISSAKGRILTSDKMNMHNTFKEPGRIVPESFHEFKLSGNRIAMKLPAKSVVILEIS